MKTLLPHLKRATRFNQVFSELRANTEALNCLATGVVVLDDKAEVIFVNHEAEEIFSQQDGLRFVGRTIKADSYLLRRQLESAVARAIQTSLGRGIESGGALNISRPSGKPGYVVVISPTSSSDAFPKSLAYLRGLTRQPRAVIFITNPEKACDSDAQLLRQRYRLTPTESKIALLLMQGKSALEVRDTLSITANTTKTHLKHLFEKVGVRRQAELVSVLYRWSSPVRKGKP